MVINEEDALPSSSVNNASEEPRKEALKELRNTWNRGK